MDEDISAIDPSDFDPSEASEKLCWAMLPKVQHETKAETLIALGRHAYARGEYDAAATFADQAQEVWKSVGNDLMEAHALFNAGCSYKEVKQFPEAISRLQTAIALYLEASDYLGACKATFELAASLHGDGKQSEAGNAYIDCVKYSKMCDEDGIYFTAVETYAQFLFDHKSHKEIDELLAEEMPRLRQSADAIRVSELNATWAMAKNYLGDKEGSLALIKTAREVADVMLLKQPAGLRRVLEASILIELRRFEEASELLDFAADIALDLRDTEMRMHISLWRAEAFLELGDYASAFGFAEEVFSIATTSGDLSDIQSLRFVLAHAGAMCGNEELAYQYLLDYKADAEEVVSDVPLRNRVTQTDFLEGLVMTRLELIDKNSNQTFDYVPLSGALFDRFANVGEFSPLEYDFIISNALLAYKQRTKNPDSIPACDPEDYQLVQLICRLEQLDTNNDRKAAMYLGAARVLDDAEGFFSASMALSLFTHTSNETEAKRAAQWVRKLAPHQEDLISKSQCGTWVEFPSDEPGWSGHVEEPRDAD